MDTFFEPRKMGHYKRRCHEVMEEIWGDTKKGRAGAYRWLKFNCNVQHISEINNETRSREVYNRLWKKSFGFE